MAMPLRSGRAHLGAPLLASFTPGPSHQSPLRSGRAPPLASFTPGPSHQLDGEPGPYSLAALSSAAIESDRLFDSVIARYPLMEGSVPHHLMRALHGFDANGAAASAPVAPSVRSSTFIAALPSVPATSAIPPAAAFFEAAAASAPASTASPRFGAFEHHYFDRPRASPYTSPYASPRASPLPSRRGSPGRQAAAAEEKAAVAAADAEALALEAAAAAAIEAAEEAAREAIEAAEDAAAVEAAPKAAASPSPPCEDISRWPEEVLDAPPPRARRSLAFPGSGRVPLTRCEERGMDAEVVTEVPPPTRIPEALVPKGLFEKAIAGLTTSLGGRPY